MGGDGGGGAGGGIGGGAMSGGPGGQTGADGAPVDTHGTARDFGNMLNAYKGGRVKRPKGRFSPWTAMKGDR